MTETNVISQESNPKHRPTRLRRALTFAFLLLTFDFSSPAFATPSQEEVFKSLQQNLGQNSDDSGRGLAILLAAGGALILVMLIGSRVRRRQSTPKATDHPGKLMREVMKTVPLRPKELKQLKLLAEESRQSGSDEPVQSPLTLVLCPSVLARTLKRHPAKVDRAVMASLIRKMGVAREVKSQK
jgi:hypothetical protein